MKRESSWAIAWRAQREAHLELDMETQPLRGLEVWLLKLSMRLGMASVWWHQVRHHKPHDEGTQQ